MKTPKKQKIIENSVLKVVNKEEPLEKVKIYSCASCNNCYYYIGKDNTIICATCFVRVKDWHAIGPVKVKQ